jgi:hypothetical protein
VNKDGGKTSPRGLPPPHSCRNTLLKQFQVSTADRSSHVRCSDLTAALVADVSSCRVYDHTTTTSMEQCQCSNTEHAGSATPPLHQPVFLLAGMAVRGEERNEQIANELANVKGDGPHEPKLCRSTAMCLMIREVSADKAGMHFPPAVC